MAAGCSGDTDQATKVRAHSAQLNFHGKADNGPAYSYFEYWRSDDPSNKLKTQTRHWPAGAEASFGEQPQHLAERTDYSFRVCGNDEGKEPICASTKRFTTAVARSTVSVDGDGVAQFVSDPGVNNNLFSDVVDGFGLKYLVIGEAFFDCADGAGTCGSHLEVTGCQFSEGSDASGAWCNPDAVNIRLGDLDDRADVGDYEANASATIHGGAGNDTLEVRAVGGATVTGGRGRDDVSTGSGNDTIHARSAAPLDPDIDQAIRCGQGEDTVIADRRDPISEGQNGCEHVSKP